MIQLSRRYYNEVYDDILNATNGKASRLRILQMNRAFCAGKYKKILAAPNPTSQSRQVVSVMQISLTEGKEVYRLRSQVEIGGHTKRLGNLAALLPRGPVPPSAPSPDIN
ncbi:hypothetical protein CR513_55587, partial [Mucuna pruriens]